MIKKILCLLVSFLPIAAFAQKELPKAVEKARQAVFSVVTYDDKDKILHTGNGVFVTGSGVALSDYSLFKGARRAIIVQTDGKQYPVKSILGANDMYDMIKFQVDTEKKVSYLQPAPQAPVTGSTAYLIPYSTQKDKNRACGEITEITVLPGGYNYYTLKIPFNEKAVSCPVTNQEGQIIGLIQKNTLPQANDSYAIAADYGLKLHISALSAADPVLRTIGIRKALPEKEDQALAYIYMSSPVLSPEEYVMLLDEFIERYPSNAEGYIRRADYYINNAQDDKHYKQAEEDWNKALKVADKKGDIHYNKAKQIYTHLISQPGSRFKNWNYPLALEQNSKALAADSLPLYILQRGDIYFAMKDYANAFENYDKVNHSDLVSPATYYHAAKAKELSGGEPKEVVALLDSAVIQFGAPLPETAAPYIFERGQSKAEAGLYKEAVADYNLFYDLVKGEVNDLFYFYREQTCYHAKMFKQALEDIKKAVGMKPDDVTYLAELGAVNLRISRYDEAISNLKAALAIDPKLGACYRLIGYCQVQQGKITEACENFLKAKELGDGPVDQLIEKYCK